MIKMFRVQASTSYLSPPSYPPEKPRTPNKPSLQTFSSAQKSEAKFSGGGLGILPEVFDFAKNKQHETSNAGEGRKRRLDRWI
jgi:hypothetical protein